MAVDMSIEPWPRLANLAPPNTTTPQLQTAANRYALRADVYAAAADLWEEAAMLIDLSPDTSTGSGSTDRVVNKVSQDGITVEYASDGLIGNNMSSRVAQHGQYMTMVRRLRARSKPSTPLVHEDTYNPWLNTPLPQDDEVFIVVDEV